MSTIVEKNRSRVIYVSSGGDDSNDGFSDTFAKKTLAAAITAASDEAPTLFDPVLIRGLDGARYFENVTFEDYIRVNMEDCSVTGSVNLPLSAYVKLASVVTLSGGAGTTAVSTNGKSQTSIEAFGIFTNSAGDTGYDVSGASSDVFCRVGQIAVNADNSTAISYTSSGTPRRLSVNEINLGNVFTGSTPTNCIGIKYDSTNNAALVIEGSALTQNGTGNQGIDLVQGRLVTLIPDIELGTDTAVFIHSDGIFSHQGALIQGDIENEGDAEIFCQSIDGNIQNSSDLEILSQDIQGNITITDGVATFSTQKFTGDYLASGGATTLHSQAHFGDITCSGGLHFFDVQAQVGDLTCDGATATVRLSIDSLNGDFTVSGGAQAKGQISEVTGNVVIEAGSIFDGEIDGIEYGAWIDGTEIVTTGIRQGNIQGSYDDPCLRVQIDTTTDTVDEILLTYRQNPNGSREVGMRVIDRDDSTVYWEATNTATGSGEKNYVFDLAADLVNALPVNQVVNLDFQAERVIGNGTQLAGAQLTITRTP